ATCAAPIRASVKAVQPAAERPTGYRRRGRRARSLPPRRMPTPAQAVAPASRRRPAGSTRLYDAPFWYAYLNNLCLMMAMSLLFRFGDYIAVLCGKEMDR